MTSVRQASISVKAASPRRGPGQPSKQTPERIQAINRAVVQAALSGDEIPSHVVLAGEHGVSERTVRNIRLRTLGLNRHELRQWQQRGRRDFSTRRSAEPELVCTTPFVGLWWLVPQIIDAGCQYPCPRPSSATILPIPSNAGGCSYSRTNQGVAPEQRQSMLNIGSDSTTRWASPSTSTPWSDTVCPRHIRCFACRPNRDRSARRLPQPKPLTVARPSTWLPGSSS